MGSFARSPFPTGPDLIGDVWKGEWYPAHCYKIPAVAALNGILQQVGASPTGTTISDAEVTLAQLKEYHEQLAELASNAESTQKQVVFFLQCVQSTALSLQKQASKRIATVEKSASKFKKWFWKGKQESSANWIAPVISVDAGLEQEGNTQTSSSEEEATPGPQSWTLSGSLSSTRTTHMRSLSYSLSPSTSKAPSPEEDDKEAISKTTSFAKTSLPRSFTKIAQSSPAAGSQAQKATTGSKKEFSLSSSEFDKIMGNLVEEDSQRSKAPKQPQQKAPRKLIGRRSLGAADFDKINITAFADAVKSADIKSPRSGSGQSASAPAQEPKLSKPSPGSKSRPPESKNSGGFLSRTISPGKLLSRTVSPGRSISPHAHGQILSKPFAALRHLSPVKADRGIHDLQTILQADEQHPRRRSESHKGGTGGAGAGNGDSREMQNLHPHSGRLVDASASRDNSRGMSVGETISEEAALEFEDIRWSDKSSIGIRGLLSDGRGPGESPNTTPPSTALLQRARSARHTPASPMYSVSAQALPGDKAGEPTSGPSPKMSRTLSRRGAFPEVRGSPAGSVASMPSSPSLKRLQHSSTMLDRSTGGGGSPIHPPYRGRKSGHERLLEIMSNVHSSWAAHPANCGGQGVSATSSPVSDASSERLSSRFREGSFQSDETMSHASGSDAGGGRQPPDPGFPRPPPGPGPKKQDSAGAAKGGLSAAKKKQEEMLLEMLKAAPPIKWSHTHREVGGDESEPT